MADTDIKIITMNMGLSRARAAPGEGGPGPVQGTAESRRQVISPYWRDEQPDIVLAQKVSASTKDDWKLNRDHIVGYRCQPFGAPTSFAYKRAEFDMEHILIADDRIYGAVFLHTRIQGLRVFCVSYNGPYALAERENALANMLTTVGESRERHLHDHPGRNITATVIAGIFYLTADEANNAIDDASQRVIRDYALLTPNGTSKNYFLHQGFNEAPTVAIGYYSDDSVERHHPPPGYPKYRPVVANFHLNAPLPPDNAEDDAENNDRDSDEDYYSEDENSDQSPNHNASASDANQEEEKHDDELSAHFGSVSLNDSPIKDKPSSVGTK